MKKNIFHISLIIFLIFGLFSCEKDEEYIEKKVTIIEKDLSFIVNGDTMTYEKTYGYYCENQDPIFGFTRDLYISNNEDFPFIHIDDSELGDFKIHYHEEGGEGCTYFNAIINYNGINAEANSALFDGGTILDHADYNQLTGSISGEIFVHDTVQFMILSLGDFSIEFDTAVTDDCQ